MRKLLLCIGLFLTLRLSGQGVTIGNQVVPRSGTGTITNNAPASYVNLTDLATGAGTVDHATVWWSRSSAGACTNAFKVVFLRTGFATVSQFNVVAARGPFNAVQGRNDVVLSPPVSVQNGDLIGIVQLQPTSCGAVQMQFYDGGGNVLITTSDISASGSLGPSSNYAPGRRLGVFAYSGEQPLVAIIPAAGSVQGASAFFRTSLQMLNAGDTASTVRIVFHPQGQAASASDPSTSVTINPGAMFTDDDFVTSRLGVSGLGSLDFFSTGGALPIITARVYSDAGALGTSGFSQEALKPTDTFGMFSGVYMPIPKDLTNFRMNIGVRTIDRPVTMNITTYNAGGSVIASRTGVSYPANYFIQTSLSEFTGIGSLNAAVGGWIVVGLTISADDPRAFVYSSVIDNRTSDSTYRLARPY